MSSDCPVVIRFSLNDTSGARDFVLVLVVYLVFDKMLSMLSSKLRVLVLETCATPSDLVRTQDLRVISISEPKHFA